MSARDLLAAFRKRRQDAARWKGAQSMADLGELVIAWMRGEVGGTPSHPAPADPETGPLKDALTTLNRNGFVTENSQLAETVDGESWNTWVAGFASDGAVARMRAAVAGTPLKLSACRGRVHECGSRFPRFPYPSPWQCPGKGARGEWASLVLADAWWVYVEDLEPGRNDLLWPTLTAALERPEENPDVPSSPALAVPRPRGGDHRPGGDSGVLAAAPRGGPRGRAVPGGSGNRPGADRGAAPRPQAPQAEGAGMEDPRPDNREEHAMTSTAVNVTGMYDAAAEALADLARKAQPSARNRALSLAGHEPVVLGLERCAQGVRDALECAAVAVRDMRSTAGSDLFAVLCDASHDAGAAAGEVTAAQHALAETVRDTRGQASRREPAAATAARAAAEALEAIPGFRHGPGMAAESHARIAAALQRMLTGLSSALSHEAVLIDGAYEDLRRGRESGNVAGPLVRAYRRVMLASKRVRVAEVVLRDGA